MRREQRTSEAQSLEAQTPATRITLGLLMAGVAVVILLTVFGVIPHEDEGSPLAAVGSLAFLVAGAVIAWSGIRDLLWPVPDGALPRRILTKRAGRILGAFLATILGVIPTAIAIAPLLASEDGVVSGVSLTARIVFGLSAIIVDAAALWLWYWVFTDLRHWLASR